MKTVPQKKEQKGFTLIEAIVSIGLFTIVAVIALTALLNLSSASKRSQNTRAIVDSLGYVLEDFSRTAQAGGAYTCVDTEGGVCVSFETTIGTDQVKYFFQDDNGNGTVQKQVGSAAAQRISPPGVDVTKVAFYLSEAPAQARVEMILQATIAGGTKYQNSINLQTTVTSR